MTTLNLKLRGAWRSLTIWFNSVSLTLFAVLPTAQDAFPQMQAYLPEHLYKWGMGIVIAANIALRFKTASDLADKGRPKS